MKNALFLKTLFVVAALIVFFSTPVLACLDGDYAGTCFSPDTNQLILYFTRVLLFAIVLSLAVITAYNIYLETKHKKNPSKSKPYLTRIKASMVLFFIMFATLAASEIISRSFEAKDAQNKLSVSQDKIMEKYIPPANEWLTAEFPDGYSAPDLDIQYPANWHWACCNDMDHASVHLIYPNKAKNRDENSPKIKISDYSLRDCPADRPGCSIDQTVGISPDRKLAIMDDKFAKQYNQIATTSVGVKGYEAKVFEATDKDGAARLFYLFGTGTDVVSIEFYNMKFYDDNFINAFLQKID